MYEQFYGFKEKPFSIVPNPDYLYFSAKHENALTYLEYGIREAVGFILLTGEIGTGKTTLIRYILNDIESEVEVAVVFNTNVTGQQLIDLVLREFDIEPARNDKAKNIDQLYSYLVAMYAKNKRVILIIDEAQNLEDEVLEEVRMLSNLQSDDSMLLQIMLVGQPALKMKLKRPTLAQLAQRIAVNYHLTALSRKETAEYIASRLNMAGGDEGVFTKPAVDKIHDHTNGIPRSINLLCDTALVFGYAGDVREIDESVIEQVIEDRGDLSVVDQNGKERGDRDETINNSDNASLSNSRLIALEANVEQLKVQVAWQIEELETRAEHFKDELISQLREQIEVERGKSEYSMISFGELKEKYENLKMRLEANSEEIKKEQSGEEDSVKEKKWFLGGEWRNRTYPITKK